MAKPKLYVIVGPTASGKSDYAVELAQKINGEIISADSRQVYKGLNIGTGKITEKEMRGIKHYMLDIVDPKKVYNASDYKNDAKICIEKIFKKKKVPIICGGTGFYISTLLGEIQLANIPINPKLRLRSRKLSKDDLFRELLKIDPKRAETIDRHNPVRLIRAIEIAKADKKLLNINPINSTEKSDQELKDIYKISKIGLDFEDNVLKKRIHDRLIKRIEIGMIEEAKNLHKNRLSFRRMRELGLEYKYLADLLQKKISQEEFITKLETEIWQYAKRQRTWFRKDNNIRWLKI